MTIQRCHLDISGCIRFTWKTLKYRRLPTENHLLGRITFPSKYSAYHHSRCFPVSTYCWWTKFCTSGSGRLTQRFPSIPSSFVIPTDAGFSSSTIWSTSDKTGIIILPTQRLHWPLHLAPWSQSRWSKPHQWIWWNYRMAQGMGKKTRNYVYNKINKHPKNKCWVGKSPFSTRYLTKVNLKKQSPKNRYPFKK